jgi:signal transduction histidine kinase
MHWIRRVAENVGSGQSVEAEHLARSAHESVWLWRRWSIAALVGILYFCAGGVGLVLGGSQAQQVFPPAGLAIAAPLLFGLRVWPGVFFGALGLGFMTISDPLMATALAVGNTVEGYAGAWAVGRYAGGARFYERPRDIFVFVLLAGVLSPLLCPPFLMTKVSLPGFLVWWLGEMTSVLVLTPLLLVWCGGRGARKVARGLEVAALLWLLAALSVMVLTDLFPAWEQRQLLPYLCLPFSLWAAFRCGPGITTLAIFAQTLAGLWGTLRGHGLFALTIQDQPVLSCQGFMIFNAVLSLLVSATVVRRKEGERALQQATEELNLRVRQRTQALDREIEVRRTAEGALARIQGEQEQRVQERTAELRQVNQSLENENRQRRQAEEALSRVLHRLIDAQEAERRRISRELHDEMGQNLTALKLGLQRAAEWSAETKPDQPTFPELQGLADRLMRDVHRISWELRPAVLDDLGLAPALLRYVEDWSARSGIAADFQDFALRPERLPAAVETTLYRVAQETLANVLRHSKARQVSVVLHPQAHSVSLIVEDDGQGFDVRKIFSRSRSEGEMGLIGMQERVRLAGGSMEIESKANSGTSVYVRIPVDYSSIITPEAESP